MTEPRTVRLSAVLWVALVVALAAAWLLLARGDRLFGPAAADGPERPGSAPPVGEPGAAGHDAHGPGDPARAWTSALGSDPAWPPDIAAPADCESAEDAMLRLCRALDREAPFADARIAGGSCAVIRDAVTAVARRPPHVSGELGSHATVLDNVFHLFRAVGRERLGLLRTAVATRPELAEPAAMAVWRWAATRETCARSGRSDLDARALYEQAAFLLETMAGQAYLRRRSPRDEALATFYAVLAVERADLDDRNEHGVDLRPAVARATALLEGRDLVFTDRYLATLAAVERRWATRGGGDPPPPPAR